MSSALSDAERMINAGIKIETTKFGKATVKELSLENLIKLSSDLVLLLQLTASGDTKSKGADNNFAFISYLMSSPELIGVIRRVAAASTSRDEEDFTNMGIKDWLAWLVAFKKVIDWEEIKNLFLQLIPEENLRGLLSLFQTKVAEIPPPG